jgi:hypothetical protein
MGKAIPTQHPAVVLRSHFNFVRALLGVTMLAVVGLTIAVVIVANDGDEVGSPAAVRPIESIEYGGFNPSTGRPDAAPLPQVHPLQNGLGSTRYDGGPEEGTRGIVGAQPGAAPLPARKLDGSTDTPRLNPQQASPGLSDRAREGKGGPADGIRYDGGPDRT